MPRNPENIFVAMIALLAFASPAQADLINHTYWAYIPNPPLLQVIKWTDIGPVISTNDSVHMPPPWSLDGPSHPEEEGRLINVSLGYEILPLCMGPAELCINVSRRHGLSSCLQKRTSTHCLDCLLPCPFMRTMSILPKL